MSGAKAKFLGSTQSKKPVRRFNQGLARHTAAQNAETANFVFAVDAECFQPKTSRCGGGRIAGTSTANHHEIIGIHPEIDFRTRLPRNRIFVGVRPTLNDRSANGAISPSGLGRTGSFGESSGFTRHGRFDLLKSTSPP